METYSYVNIFETKGLEYMLLMSFLVLFILLVRYLKEPTENDKNNQRRNRHPATQRRP